MSPLRPVLLSAVLGLCSAVASAQVPAPAPTPATAPSADPAWDAAMALKRKADYLSAAQAFDAWAAANADKPRLGEGLTEAGVCWFSVGKSQLKLLRTTPESKASFEKSLAFFDRVLALGKGPYGGRAQHMRGSVKFFAGDMAGAELEYSKVLETWKDDPTYVSKALEKRAAVRRNLLRTKDAIADLSRYVKDYPQGDQIAGVQAYLNYCQSFEQPAPPLQAEAWIQGEPTTLEALKGDVVMLFFFAKWCENCEAVRPFLLDVAQRYQTMGVHVIGIVTHSKGQDVPSVLNALVEKKITFPVMMDMRDTPTSESGKTTNSYRGTKIPDVVLIDRMGRMRWHDNPNNLPDVTLDTLLLEDPTKPAASK